MSTLRQAPTAAHTQSRPVPSADGGFAPVPLALAIFLAVVGAFSFAADQASRLSEAEVILLMAPMPE